MLRLFRTRYRRCAERRRNAQTCSSRWPLVGDRTHSSRNTARAMSMHLSVCLPAMVPYIDLPRALSRGRYTARRGDRKQRHTDRCINHRPCCGGRWTDIQDAPISDIVATMRCSMPRIQDWPFEHLNGARYSLAPTGKRCVGFISWHFRQTAKSYPIISSLRQSRDALSEIASTILP